ncbi:hypothetical protein Slin14017_G035250 [Septoria linicola]|nr:hypothetical protein Slin14017_G035250 [Septoria linicola]
MAELTREQALDALAREELQLKWDKEDFEDREAYKKKRREKELRMLELRERASFKMAIDLTSDGDGDGDLVTIKNEDVKQEGRARADVLTPVSEIHPAVRRTTNSARNSRSGPSGAQMGHVAVAPGAEKIADKLREQ